MISAKSAQRGLSVLLAILIIHSTTTNAQSLNAEQEFATIYTQYTEAVKSNSFEDALKYASLGVTVATQAFGVESDQVAVMLQNQGYMQLQLQRNDEAFNSFTRSIATLESLHGNNSNLLIRPLVVSAFINTSAGVKKSHDKLLGRAVKISENFFSGSTMHANTLWAIADNYSNIGFSRDAVKFAKRAITALEKRNAVNPAHLAKYDYLRGVDAFFGHRDKKALEHLSSALDYYGSRANNLPMLKSTLSFLAQLREAGGESELATNHLIALGKSMLKNGTLDPQLVYAPSPKFVKHKIVRNDHATVKLIMDIDKTGRTHNIRILDYTGSQQWRASVTKAAESFRFVPAFENGEPIEYSGFDYTFEYNRENPRIWVHVID